MADSNIADIKVEDVKTENNPPVEPANKDANDANGKDAAVEKIKLEDVKNDDTKTEVKNEVAGSDTKDIKIEGGDKKDEIKPRAPRRYSNGMLKTSHKQDPEDSRKNSRYDPTRAPKPEEDKIPAAIRGQVEFYFSDSNLPGDKFLWNLTDGSSNLPVPLENIMTFGRMKIFKSQPEVVAALRDSAFLKVSGEEGKECVSRKIAYLPIPTEKEAQQARSVYVKGFGDEAPTSQFDIEAFFAPYGPTKAVRLRRTEDKLFKGSVFVEFESEDLAKAFLALDPKPLWNGDNILKVLSKKEYQEIKEQEIKDGITQPSQFRGPRGRGNKTFRGGNRGGGRGKGDRGGFKDREGRDDKGRDRDPNDWKKRREDDRANGFKDDRRGGRGRGRGGNRGGRGNDRNREREGRNGDNSEVKKEVNESETPVAEKNEKKRERENDGAEDSSTKKIKSEGAVTATE